MRRPVRALALEPMQIRTAVPSDAEAIARVQVAAWRLAYRGIIPDGVLAGETVESRTVRWGRILAHGQGITLVAASGGGEIVGFGSPGPARDADVTPETGELYALYVLPDRWGTGTGWALWRASRDYLRAEAYREVIVWVLEENARARAFYRRVGLRRDPAVARDFRIGGAALPEVRYRAPLGPAAP